ncbi:MAG: 6-bladed beta-propeller [Pseudomonadota bacterium]
MKENVKTIWSGLAGVVLIVLTGCAEVQEGAGRAPVQLVFPAPPDEPRFVLERVIYSSADVLPVEEDSALKSLLTGGGRSGERMSKPHAVAVHKGRVFVSDSVRRLVEVFDIPEKKYFTIGDNENDPDGELRMPLGMDVDGEGNLYVADSTNKKVKVYSRDGKHLRDIGGPEWFSRLASVGVDKAGEKAFVADIGGTVTSAPESHRIRVFNAKTGEHLYDFGKRGTGDDEFNLIRDVVVGPDGLLYIVDSGNFRVKVHKQDGTFVRAFGKIGLQLGNFSRPKEIAVDKGGNIYVVDAAFGNFQIFDPQGNLLMFIGTRSDVDYPARYSLPSGLAVDEDGRIFMVDQIFRKLDVYRPAALKVTEGYAAPFRATGATQAQ